MKNKKIYIVIAVLSFVLSCKNDMQKINLENKPIQTDTALIINDWKHLGQPGFTMGQALFSSMVLHPDNTVYVAYSDETSNYKLTVKQFKNDKITLTVSIGLTATKPAEASINNTLRRADKALYQAKNSGRNRVIEY